MFLRVERQNVLTNIWNKECEMMYKQYEIEFLKTDYRVV